MKIDVELVEKLAKLSRMRLTDSETAQYSKQLTDIVEFVEALSEVKDSDQARIRQIAGLSNVMRADAVEECDHVDALLQEFPERDDRELSVPSVL